MDALEASRRIVDILGRAAGPEHRVAVRFWNGSTWGAADAAGTLVLTHPGALRAALWPPNDLSAGEAYVFDDIDIEGDIFAVLAWAQAALERIGARERLQVLAQLRALPREAKRRGIERPTLRGRRHSKRRDRRAIAHHYDVGNDFYRLFLGETMAYSCAVFLDPAEPLDVAQRRKIDLICRKLQLEPGMRFLDVGAGWGGLVVHAASRYGVRAVGITLSEQQAKYAEQLAIESGVADRVEIRLQDYRDVDDTFDAIASVGMVEHVGRKELGGYFRHLRSILAPHGQLLNHGIVTRTRKPGRRRPTFVNTWVFPDGELETVDETIGSAEDAGFELRDAQALRMSYATTLRHWVGNLEANADIARSLAPETTYRIWRSYMAGSALAFEGGHISIFQLLLSDPQRAWTYGRRHLLAEDDR